MWLCGKDDYCICDIEDALYATNIINVTLPRPKKISPYTRKFKREKQSRWIIVTQVLDSFGSNNLKMSNYIMIAGVFKKLDYLSLKSSSRVKTEFI